MKLSKVVALIAVFIAGALTSSVVGLWHPYVTVKVTNLDARSVEQIEVRFQNTEGKGTFNPYFDSPLKTGEQMEFHFYVESEGAFSMKAKYSDTTSAEGVPGYVELGNLVEVVILENEVKLASGK